MSLAVRDLAVEIGGLYPVRGVDLDVAPGRSLGVVGESGSGKTLTALSIVGLLPHGASASGSVRVGGRDVLALDEKALSEYRRSTVGMIFQDPMSALNPLKRVGAQVRRALPTAVRRDRTSARREVHHLLDSIRIRDPERTARSFPHELSGGERQRILLAIALAGQPEVLIADEPTTALDSVVRVEMLRLLRDVGRERGHSLVVITHDLAVVAALCDDIAVMYGGRVVETGPAETVMNHARHRYTAALLRAMPRLPELPSETARPLLVAIPGSVPFLGRFPEGCAFRDRCDAADGACAAVPPLAERGGRSAACWHPVDDS